MKITKKLIKHLIQYYNKNEYQVTLWTNYPDKKVIRFDKKGIIDLNKDAEFFIKIEKSGKAIWLKKEVITHTITTDNDVLLSFLKNKM